MIPATLFYSRHFLPDTFVGLFDSNLNFQESTMCCAARAEMPRSEKKLLVEFSLSRIVLTIQAQATNFPEVD
jgi:hypothetical protein